MSWPGLTADLVTRHLPLSSATIRGHLHRERQHLQSTQKSTTTTNKETTTPSPAAISDETQDFFPSTPEPNIKTHMVMYSLIDKNTYSIGYQDLTGRFPVHSSRGNEYILVGYHYDANLIWGLPIKNTTAIAVTTAWTSLHKEFSQAGTAPDVWVLDNEVSQNLKLLLKTTKHNISWFHHILIKEIL